MELKDLILTTEQYLKFSQICNRCFAISFNLYEGKLGTGTCSCICMCTTCYFVVSLAASLAQSINHVELVKCLQPFAYNLKAVQQLCTIAVISMAMQSGKQPILQQYNYHFNKISLQVSLPGCQEAKYLQQ